MRYYRMRRRIRDGYEYSDVLLKSYRDYMNELLETFDIENIEKAKTLGMLLGLWNDDLTNATDYSKEDIRNRVEEWGFERTKQDIINNLENFLLVSAQVSLEDDEAIFISLIPTKWYWKLSTHEPIDGKADWYADYDESFGKLWNKLKNKIIDYDKYSDMHYELKGTPDHLHFKIDLGRVTYYLDHVPEEEWDKASNGDWD